MRALGKENEELHQQVKELSEALKATQDAKGTVKASAERNMQKKDMEISKLEEELECLHEALTQSKQEASEKSAAAEEGEERLKKTNASLNQYQAYLEKMGINAVSLQQWTKRSEDRCKDVAELEEQLKSAMEDLASSKEAIKARIDATEGVCADMQACRAELRAVKEKTFIVPEEKEEAPVEPEQNEKEEPEQEQACGNTDADHDADAEAAADADAAAEADADQEPERGDEEEAAEDEVGSAEVATEEGEAPADELFLESTGPDAAPEQEEAPAAEEGLAGATAEAEGGEEEWKDAGAWMEGQVTPSPCPPSAPVDAEAQALQEAGDDLFAE